MVYHIRIQLGKILRKRLNRNNSAVKLSAAESTGRQSQTAWQTAVSHCSNNPHSQWKRARSVRAAQLEHQQWKCGVRGRPSSVARVSGPPVSREPFRRAPMQQGLKRNCRWEIFSLSTTQAKTFKKFFNACIHAGFLLTYESSKACRETSVFDISFFQSAGWLCF